ncbi:hypothetical protein SDC9_127045 [bioreactor metagenome]|uniref:Uncharacterized protein n=1 Tax=bioreactor metagenome TaxID=1076179 RepID=A0A645CTH2_9ZZZZ
MHQDIEARNLPQLLCINILHISILRLDPRFHFRVAFQGNFKFIPDIVHQIMVIIAIHILGKPIEFYRIQLAKVVSIPVEGIDIGKPVAIAPHFPI